MFARNIDKEFAFLGLNIFPGILARAGSKGRQLLFQRFHAYYTQDSHREASRMVKARYDVNRKYGVAEEDIEHFDLSVCIGLLVNTVPGASWALFYAYSSPSLLQEIRAAISSITRISEDPVKRLTYSVNIAEIAAGCPLLKSLVQETLRMQSTNASGRVVLQDTLLEDRYLLKKDSLLLVSSAELHYDSSVWGMSSRDFDPRRFMHGAAKPVSAYRAFGSGDALCPGRFLAANEILTVLVMTVSKYDITPRPRGRWVTPKSRPHITTSILTPTEDIPVELVERNGFEHVHWNFCWTS